MQDLLEKDSDISVVHLMAPHVVGSASWLNSTKSQVQQPSLTKNLSLKIATAPQVCPNAKQLGIQFQDQESSSTQSTGQSFPEVASVGESNPYGQSIISMQSGNCGTHGKPEEGHIESTSSMGGQGYVLPYVQDYQQSFACIPVSYPDPYNRGLLAAYGPQAVIYHPQMMSMTSNRVPLPLNLPQDYPIYVNAKQYHAILRRRQYRAKLEAQSKLPKVRKPYLHESRHLHALKRARGSGGRFLNTKTLQESKPPAMADGLDVSDSAQLRLTTKMSESEVHQLENCKEGTPTTSCSEITSGSNSDNIFCQQEERFSFYPFRVGRPMQLGGDNTPGQNQHYFSVLR